MRTLNEDELAKLDKIVERDDFPDIKEILAGFENVKLYSSLRKNLQFYLNNYWTTLPNNNPKCFYINLRIHENNTAQLIKGIFGSFSSSRFRGLDVLYALSPPMMVYIDFTAITSSDTRQDFMILHPSIPVRKK